MPGWQSQRPLILAHRGGGGEAPENSLEAFQRAVDAGFDFLETDVHLAVDGNLYLHHGTMALRPNRLLALDKPYTSLKELFEAFPNCHFSVDAKHEPAAEPLAKLIAEYGMADTVVVVSPAGTNDARAGRIARLAEELGGKRPATALSSIKSTIDIIANKRGLASDKDAVQATMIYVHRKCISPRTIRCAHDQGLIIIAWTVNDLATMHKFLAWGVDGFMTDFPTVAKELLA